MVANTLNTALALALQHPAKPALEDSTPSAQVTPRLPSRICLKGQHECQIFDGYATLDHNKQDIRLMRFIDTEGPIIRCSMSKCALEDVQDQYIALSYYWGVKPPVDMLRPILINGQAVLVRPSLHTFLQSLAKRYGSTAFWVDVLCINQCDISERSSQVAMMKDVYASAKEVCVWLGGGDSDSEYAFTQVIWHQTNGQLSNPQLFLYTVEALFFQRYWTRMWVIQEFAAAKELTLLCGRSAVSWEAFSQAVDSAIQSSDFNINLDVYKRFKKLRRVYHSERAPLLTLMQEFNQARCDDPYDKAYALRGLAIGSGYISIDYSKNTMYMVIQLIRSHLESHMHHDNRSLVDILNLFPTISRYFPVSAENLIEGLQDWAFSDDFACDIDTAMKVVSVEPTALADPPYGLNLHHSPNTALITCSGEESMRPFRYGNININSSDEVLLLHDLHLVFSSDLNDPQVIDVLWPSFHLRPDEFCKWGREPGTMSFEDAEAIKNLYRRCVNRCCVGDQDLDEDRTLLECRRRCHIKPIILIIHIYSIIQPILAWELLSKASQYMQKNLLESRFCSCKSESNRLSVRSSAILGTISAGHGRFGVEYEQECSISKYADCEKYEKRQLHQRRHSEGQLVERTREMQSQLNECLMPAETLFERLGYGVLPPEKFPRPSRSKKLLYPDITEHLYEASSMSMRTTCLDMDVVQRGMEVIGTLSDCNDVQVRCYVGRCTLSMAATRFNLDRGSKSYPNSTFNLDAVIANDNGELRWVEAFYMTQSLSKLERCSNFGRKMSLRFDVGRPVKQGTLFYGNTRTIATGLITHVERGGFTASSRNVRLNPHTMILEADLLCGNGSYRRSELNLSERIIVLDGGLRYVFMAEVRCKDGASKIAVLAV